MSSSKTNVIPEWNGLLEVPLASMGKKKNRARGAVLLWIKSGGKPVFSFYQATCPQVI
jgi:hypothetical protein